ncbi:beta-microseminoprotein A1-like [Clarias gariepinus]|uniref:beta-microseminoprotein A1-like n=1 Tax=Clarias gariepinus TaxID=13013 RepID=UPI00234CF7E5|nr:beta-microseminoprotein A1-like [Clarias gariepinus]
MSVLKISLFVGFLLLGLVSMSHAECWHKQLDEGATQCVDSVDNTLHDIGTNWKNSKCNDCSCLEDNMKCCDGWPTKVSDDCVIFYDYKTCKFEVINEKDPDAECAVAG